ncbi:MAG: hypothetical protein LN413_00580 [Candidatus Thermoplasmatota archaeon]|nr:hypothetical protein [Candidatus Thermoplasmatota archaeon]
MAKWGVISAFVLVGAVMLTAAVALGLSHVGDGDTHEGVVMSKGVAPPYWGTEKHLFLVVDEGSEPFIILPVDRQTFSETEVGETIVWENRSFINQPLAALGIIGGILLVIGLFAAGVVYFDY